MFNPSVARPSIYVGYTNQIPTVFKRAINDAVWRHGLIVLTEDRLPHNTVPIRPSESGDKRNAETMTFIEGAAACILVLAGTYDKPARAFDKDLLTRVKMTYQQAIRWEVPLFVFVSHDLNLTETPFTELLDLFAPDTIQGRFTTPHELATGVYSALDLLKRRHIIDPDETPSNITYLHTPAHFPRKPQPYVAHPHIFTREFWGRAGEIAALDAWSRSGDTTLIIEGPGGSGKTSLVWHWLQRGMDLSRWAGIVWWTFSRHESSIESLVRHTLSYLTGQALSAFDKIPRDKQEAALFSLLKEKSYLLVLNGLEYILKVAARLPLAGDDRESPIEVTITEPRASADLRGARFLQQLVECMPSKVIITSRFLPYDLQNGHRLLLPGVRHLYLTGLAPTDATGLLRRLQVRDESGQLQAFISRFDYHCLLLNVIAGCVNEDPQARGDFDRWYASLQRQAQRERVFDGEEEESFAPAELTFYEPDLRRRRNHLMRYALAQLSPEMRRLLRQIASFRYPIDGKVMLALNPFLPADMGDEDAVRESFTRFHHLLSELENRAFLHWSRALNRYAMHPVIRAYVIDYLSDLTDTTDHSRDHFDYVYPEQPAAVQSLDDLRHELHVYKSLVRAGHLDQAAAYYNIHLGDVLRLKLGAYNTIVTLMKPLFPDGLNQLPHLASRNSQAYAMHFLADALYHTGAYEEALPLRELSLQIELESGAVTNLGVDLIKYAELLNLSGQPAAALRVAGLARELGQTTGERNLVAWANLTLLDLNAAIGQWQAADQAYRDFHAAPATTDTLVYRARAEILHARSRFYRGQKIDEQLERAWELAQRSGSIPEQESVLRWRGELALRERDAEAAVDFFNEAGAMALAIGSLEVGTIEGGLARAYMQGGDLEHAVEIINRALARKTSFHHGDLYNSAAEVLFAFEHIARAEDCALRAYHMALGEGFPYSYWWNMERARRMLAILNVTEPPLMPYANARRRPLPFEDQIYALMEKLNVTD